MFMALGWNKNEGLVNRYTQIWPKIHLPAADEVAKLHHRPVPSSL
jgi:hypothetical protein